MCLLHNPAQSLNVVRDSQENYSDIIMFNQRTKKHRNCFEATYVHGRYDCSNKRQTVHERNCFLTRRESIRRGLSAVGICFAHSLCKLRRSPRNVRTKWSRIRSSPVLEHLSSGWQPGSSSFASHWRFFPRRLDGTTVGR